MPLVAHIDLPTFQRLREEGEEIVDPERASHQDIRELHIGLLNMMPDAALTATEHQFNRIDLRGLVVRQCSPGTLNGAREKSKRFPVQCPRLGLSHPSASERHIHGLGLTRQCGGELASARM